MGELLARFAIDLWLLSQSSPRSTAYRQVVQPRLLFTNVASASTRFCPSLLKVRVNSQSAVVNFVCCCLLNQDRLVVVEGVFVLNSAQAYSVPLLRDAAMSGTVAECDASRSCPTHMEA